MGETILLFDITKATLNELCSRYEEQIATLEKANQLIEKAWDSGDKLTARRIEYATDEKIDILIEIEEELERMGYELL